MGIVKRDSIAITVLSYVGVVVGYVNKILLFPNFLSRGAGRPDQHPRLWLAVMYAQFSALGINSTVVKFFPFFRTADKRHNGLFFWSALGVGVGFVLFTALFLIVPRTGDARTIRQGVPPVVGILPAADPARAGDPCSITFTARGCRRSTRTIISSAVNEVLLRLLITDRNFALCAGGAQLRTVHRRLHRDLLRPDADPAALHALPARIPPASGNYLAHQKARHDRRHLRSVAVPRRRVGVPDQRDRPDDAGRYGRADAGRYLCDHDVHGQRDADPLPLDGEGMPRRW